MIVSTLGYQNYYDRTNYYTSQSFVSDISKYDTNKDGYITLEYPRVYRNQNLVYELFDNK